LKEELGERYEELGEMVANLKENVIRLSEMSKISKVLPLKMQHVY